LNRIYENYLHLIVQADSSLSSAYSQVSSITSSAVTYLWCSVIVSANKWSSEKFSKDDTLGYNYPHYTGMKYGNNHKEI
jgi:hypothetical protein